MPRPALAHPRSADRRRARLAALLALGGALAGACSPTYTTHGFAPQEEELAEIVAGQDTRGSVLSRLGRPSATGSFDSDDWYYVASRMEQNMFFEPQVIDRTVVAVHFDQTGVVERVARYGLEDGRVVDLVTETTPTFGRELSVIQQLFGNVGRVDAGQVLGN